MVLRSPRFDGREHPNRWVVVAVVEANEATSASTCAERISPVSTCPAVQTSTSIRIGLHRQPNEVIDAHENQP